MQKKITFFSNDFSDFPIGPFPYDSEHSAMGEYHYYPVKGYTGRWYDPITCAGYRGPSWLVTEEDGIKYMEPAEFNCRLFCKDWPDLSE